MSNKPISLFDPAIMRQAAVDAFAKMNPLQLWRNPVMFATELAALYVLVLFVRDLVTGGEGAAFAGQIAFWLALTVWFATFAEGVAEGRGKAQAASLRRARSELTARRLVDDAPSWSRWSPENSSRQTARSSKVSQLSTRAPLRAKALLSFARPVGIVRR